MQLKQQLDQAAASGQHEVCLTYITTRGPWYHVSWKGIAEKSGGIATNIGIHFFDLLLWLFGPASSLQVHYVDDHRMAGFIDLHRARVRWFLSVDYSDLPFPVTPGQRATFRSITVDGQEIEFSEGFTDLHTRVYEEVLAGRGFGILDARQSIDLTYQIRSAEPVSPGDLAHPYLKGGWEKNGV